MVPITYRASNVTRRGYDARGQLLQETHTDGGIVKHAYDYFGNQVQGKRTAALGKPEK
ncbi:hypothetical protein ACO0LC_06420 [Undibacterium sp. JH2W]|uniref:hypothetical protein n=1 Tax=Undibacterium sp. JH2W TaxID=3413037 RepID=UPI003BF0DE5A